MNFEIKYQILFFVRKQKRVLKESPNLIFLIKEQNELQRENSNLSF